MTNQDIIAKIETHGISAARLNEALKSGDNWGQMVHAYEYLTVLGIVADAMKTAHDG